MQQFFCGAPLISDYYRSFKLSARVSSTKGTKETNVVISDTMQHENSGPADSYSSEQQKRIGEIWHAIFKLQTSFDQHFQIQQRPLDGEAQHQVPKPPDDNPIGSSQSPDEFNTVLEELKISPKHIGADQSANIVRLTRRLLDDASLAELIVNAAKLEGPDSFVLRFYRARKWEIGPALCMLTTALHWYYHDAKMESDILRNGEEVAIRDAETGTSLDKNLARDFMKQVRMGKSLLHGRDKAGRPIWYVRVRLHKPSDQCNESIERYTLYLVETIRLMLKPPVETIVCTPFHFCVQILNKRADNCLRLDGLWHSQHGLQLCQV